MHTETNSQYPTAAQQKRAMKKSRDNAYASIESALANLDDARRHLAWLGADVWLDDCHTAIAMVEDLRDAMEPDQ